MMTRSLPAKALETMLSVSVCFQPCRWPLCCRAIMSQPWHCSSSLRRLYTARDADAAKDMVRDERASACLLYAAGCVILKFRVHKREMILVYHRNRIYVGCRFLVGMGVLNCFKYLFQLRFVANCFDAVFGNFLELAHIANCRTCAFSRLEAAR